MGSISTGIGLISGIDTASLVDQLIQLESRGKILVEQRVTNLRAQQTALLDINSRLLGFQSAVKIFRSQSIFRKALASSTNEDLLTAGAGPGTAPGTYKFIVQQLVSSSQKLSRGFATRDSTPLGLTSLGFEFGRGSVARDIHLESLNGGNGIDRGRIVVTDGSGGTETIDLTDVTTLDEVLERLNSATGVSVTASVQGDHLTITDDTGGPGTLQVQDASGDTTATDLGIATTDGGAGDADAAANGVIVGADINRIGLNTALSSLNDGNGVLIRNNVADFRIQTKDGTLIDVDLGRLNAPITDATRLEDLNSGAGITINDDEEEPDIRFIARSPALDFEVDLTGVTTVGELRNRIATETNGNIQINIIDGERFQVQNTNAGGAPLKVLGAGANGTETAEDLGILNEAGVSAQTFDGELIENIAVTDPARTIGDVIDRINDAESNLDAGLPEGRKVTASLSPDGVSLLLTDNTGGGQNFKVLESSANALAVHDLGLYIAQTGGTTRDGDRLIAALGSVMVEHLNGGTGLDVIGEVPLAGTTLLTDLRQGAGLTTNGSAASPDIFIQDRDGITYTVEVDGLSTVQDLINAFNTATGGAVTLSINGQALRAETSTTGSSNFQIQDLNGASVVSELGIVADLTNSGGDVVDGVDIQPYGPTIGDSIDITDRNGNNVVVGGLTAFTSLSEIIDQINGDAAAAGVDVTVGLNATGNGLQVTDSSGGASNLVVTGNAAIALGLDTAAAGVAQDTVRGSNLQLQYVSEATKLADLNYGRGVGTGGITITDGLGNAATVQIGADAETVFDVITEINAIASSRGVKINARINDNGDGILIESAYDPADTPFVKLRIEAAGGTVAADLNLIGESDTIDNAVIDGSYERVLELNATDTLDDVVQAIIDADIPVNAAVLNTGSPAAPYRLNLTSDIAGASGELLIDTGGADLDFTTLSRGRDAKVFFGGDTPEEGFLITGSSNTIEDIVPGLTIDLRKAGSEAVTVEVQRDVESIVETVGEFVTTFNDVIQRIDALDFYDVENEKRGVLLGDPTVAQVRSLMLSTLTRRVEGVDSQFQLLSQIGIRIGSEGQVEFDEDKFRTAYENDRNAVENLFLALEAESGGTTEIAPGVTVTSTETTTTKRGVVAIFEDLLKRLIDPVDGIVTRADESFKDRIEQFEDRIEVLDERLEERRARLQQQFVQMETALARLQGQSDALASLSILAFQAQSSLNAGSG